MSIPLVPSYYHRCNDENDCTEYKLVTGEDGTVRYDYEVDKTDEIGCSNKVFMGKYIFCSQLA